MSSSIGARATGWDGAAFTKYRGKWLTVLRSGQRRGDGVIGQVLDASSAALRRN